MDDAEIWDPDGKIMILEQNVMEASKLVKQNSDNHDNSTKDKTIILRMGMITMITIRNNGDKINNFHDNRNGNDMMMG